MFPFQNQLSNHHLYNSSPVFIPIQYGLNLPIYPYPNFYSFYPQSATPQNFLTNPCPQATLQPNLISEGFRPYQEQNVQPEIKLTQNDSESKKIIENKSAENSHVSQKHKIISKNSSSTSNLQRKDSNQKAKSKISKTILRGKEKRSGLKQMKKSDEQEHLFLKYRRKNTESNIVNRVFNFLKIDLSAHRDLLGLSLTSEQSSLFRSYIECVESNWRSPMKRHVLSNLMHIDQNLPGYNQLSGIEQRQKGFSINKFQTHCRKVIISYLSRLAPISIVTSRKMKRAVWRQHLEKIRELRNYFLEALSA